jgi:hypothetical protein
VIKNGKPGTVMPAWGQAGLSDEEIWALVGFIRSEPSAEAVQWGIDQIAASRQVLVDEATLPAQPTHDGNLNNLLLVTEREVQSIAVFDGDTHRLLGHIPASYRAHGYAFDPTSDRWAHNVGPAAGCSRSTLHAPGGGQGARRPRLARAGDLRRLKYVIVGATSQLGGDPGCQDAGTAQGDHHRGSNP